MKKYDSNQPKIQDFIGLIKDQILEAKKLAGGCYLAVIDHDDHYEIEVEVSEGTIAGSFYSENLDDARKTADVIAEQITMSTGCKVFKTRLEWESALEGSD
jgi:hypothetical protein